MEPITRYIVRVLEDGEWKDWGSCDSLVDALDAMNAGNRWNPFAGREWQVLRVARVEHDEVTT